jgi:hypothetical protein
MKAVANDPVKIASLGIAAFETRFLCACPVAIGGSEHLANQGRRRSNLFRIQEPGFRIGPSMTGLGPDG